MDCRLYLAGPDVFLPNAGDIGIRKQELCRRYGFEGLYPLDQSDAVGSDPVKIFKANRAQMLAADIGVFNLTPFRGPSADAGTAFELGFMAANNKPLFGYTAVEGLYRERVQRDFGVVERKGGGSWDLQGYSIENFGLSDNLMLVRAIEESGGIITTSLMTVELSGESLAAFDAFEACLATIRERLPLIHTHHAERSNRELF